MQRLLRRDVAGPSLYADRVELSDAAFDELVADALDAIPGPLAALMDNVVVLVEEEPPAEDPDLLGLYVGTPLTERDSSYTFSPPDQVFVFRGPLLRMCADAAELAEEIEITVVHEIAHHFGIEDEQLHDWGWG
jgi:predicted Zn-dependent protease with MMP-like domain